MEQEGDISGDNWGREIELNGEGARVPVLGDNEGFVFALDDKGKRQLKDVIIGDRGHLLLSWHHLHEVNIHWTCTDANEVDLECTATRSRSDRSTTIQNNKIW